MRKDLCSLLFFAFLGGCSRCLYLCLGSLIIAKMGSIDLDIVAQVPLRHQRCPKAGYYSFSVYFQGKEVFGAFLNVHIIRGFQFG